LKNSCTDPDTLSEMGGIPRFVDLKIDEEALSEFHRCKIEVNELVMN
jgi:hypothetical protein